MLSRRLSRETVEDYENYNQHYRSVKIRASKYEILRGLTFPRGVDEDLGLFIC
jgi:hypothetical protein